MILADADASCTRQRAAATESSRPATMNLAAHVLQRPVATGFRRHVATGFALATRSRAPATGFAARDATRRG
jgi:hypothetical protein